MQKSYKIILLVIATVVIILIILGIRGIKSSSISNNKIIQVVAAENFWGSLVSQIGGSRVNVVNIISDPNADPHEYESNNVVAREIATSNYVVLNGAGYDSWGDKLLSANPNPSRIVLSVSRLLNKKTGDNPHFWYNPDYVNLVVKQIELNLINIDPSSKNYFQKNLITLESSLRVYQNEISYIKQHYSGIKVAATEDIFSYLANSAGLDLISPAVFIEATAEGNDPSTNSVVQFQQQLRSGQVKLLVYNEQTVTPLINSIKNIAVSQNIPIVGITETIQPPNDSFQHWMGAEIINLENDLRAKVYIQ